MGRSATLEFPFLASVLLVLVILALGEESLISRLLAVKAAEETDVLSKKLREVHLLARFDSPVEGSQRLVDAVGLRCVGEGVLTEGMSDLLQCGSLSCSSLRLRGRRWALMSR